MMRFRLHYGRWTFNVAAKDEDDARVEGSRLLALHHSGDFSKRGKNVEEVAASARVRRVL